MWCMQLPSTTPMGNELFQPNFYSRDVALSIWPFKWTVRLSNDTYLLSCIFLKLSDKIATGSFDKTCKLWCAETGKCFHTFRGHMAEIVSMTD